MSSRSAPATCRGGGTTGWPLPRRLLSRLGGRYARVVLGVPVADLTGGFKVWRRATLSALDLDAVAGRWLRVPDRDDLPGDCGRGPGSIECPIIFADRVAGASKLSRRIVLEAATVVWRLRFGPGTRTKKRLRGGL